jgi:membrane associated rhomboid family serine protease
MELSNPSLQIISPATARFRLLVDAFLAPTHPARLVSYKDGEAQFSIERPGKPPIFIVLIDGSREEDRSLRLRIGRLATENVGNQHIVLCANHSWMPEALKKISEEFWPKMQVYQLSSEADLELKAKQPLDELAAIFKAQKQISLPADGGPLGQLSETSFAERCTQGEAEKARLREKLSDIMKARLAPVAIAAAVLPALMFGLKYLFQRQPGSDGATVLVQLGASLAPFVREGEAWRLLSSTLLHAHPVTVLLTSLFVLSLGTTLEKIVGSARLLSLMIAGALGGSLLSTFLPRSGLALISVSGSAAGFALLGASVIIAFTPSDLPIDDVQRLRKLGLGGVFFALITSFLPGVERAANLGALIVGLSLAASGAVRAIRLDDVHKGAGSSIADVVFRGLAAVLGLSLFASVALAFLRGQPWQVDTAWKGRLSASLGQGGSGSSAEGTVPAGSEAKKPTTKVGEKRVSSSGNLTLVRRPLGESGFSIEVPESLGEASEKSEPNRATYYEFGSLGDKQQILAVVVYKQEKPLKKKTLRIAFDQAVAQVKADRLRAPGVSELTPAKRSEIDGWPTMELHARVQDSVQGRGVVQARTGYVAVLWYLYTDLLPESMQADLRAAVASLQKGEDEASSSAKSKKKKRR